MFLLRNVAKTQLDRNVGRMLVFKEKWRYCGYVSEAVVAAQLRSNSVFRLPAL